MQETWTITSSYKIKYTNKDPLPIEEIISSLRSIERLLKRTPQFIEKKYQGIEVVETEIFVNSIESGSLKEDILIRYVFKTRENYENAEELLKKICEDNPVIKNLIALSVAAMIGYGVAAATQSSSLPTTQINAYNSIVINESNNVGLSKSDIESVLDSQPNKKEMVKDALKVIKPAHLDPEAKIEIADYSELEISKEYIAETPEEYDEPLPSEKSEKYNNVEVFLHATDRDHSDKGWAGVVHEVTQGRTKFVLSPNIKPASLHGRIKVRADVIVHKIYVPSKKGYKIRDVEITRVH